MGEMRTVMGWDPTRSIPDFMNDHPVASTPPPENVEAARPAVWVNHLQSYRPMTDDEIESAAADFRDSGISYVNIGLVNGQIVRVRAKGGVK